MIKYLHSLGILMLLGFVTTFSNKLASQNHLSEGLKNHDISDKSKCFWGFDQWNNREGWTCPEILNGTVTGGTLWMTIQSEQKKENPES